ncbi:MAG: universal stress protein [Propionibacteriaceae bacterium]|jgi:nucleotide-binding universal stress UspA family protein|nr:universal stress protein [Propionibacteriaceae bacterium]
MVPNYSGRPRILVGYDGSDDAYAALDYGVAEALATGAEIALIYAVDDTVLNSVWGVVFDPEEIKQDAADMIVEAVGEIESRGVPAERIRTEVVLGNPASALVKYSEFASRVILGRCSLGKGESQFVGSTAVGVAGAAHCPVIVVSSNNPVPAQAIGKMGVGVNIEAKGRRGLPWAMDEAKRLGAQLQVISVVKASARSRWRAAQVLTVEQQDEAVDVTRIRIESIMNSMREKHPGVDTNIDICYGSPVDTLVKRSRELDLLVLEVQSGFPGNAIGGVARALMAHGHCPIALIRSKDTASRG